jgi:ubiquinone/menaquinone biosynthesis C-methylase UbiE
MSRTSHTSFKMMSFVHETLYGLFRDPYKALHAAGLQPGQAVLEVGCGPGFFTVPAAEIVGETGSLLSLDVNPLAVKHVYEKIKAAGVTNTWVIAANATQTDLPDASFDLAFVFGLGRPIGDLEVIWAELYRLIKPQGILSVEGRLRPPDQLFQFIKRQGRVVQSRKVG